MAEVMHPVGMTVAGEIIHVRDPRVLRGMASGLVCPECRQPFVAAQGSIRTWYFRHTADNPACTGSVMSDAHKFAQQIILDARELTLPALFAHASGFPDKPIQPAKLISYTNPTTTGPVRRPGYVLDVLMTVADRPLGIEVRYTHEVDATKQTKIRADNMAVIEIDISSVQPSFVYQPDAFRNYVLHSARRHWVHSPRQDQLDDEYLAELQAAAEARRIEAETAAALRIAEAEASQQAAEESWASQRAAWAEAARQATEAAVDASVIWASEYYPDKLTAPPDFASMPLGKEDIVMVFNRLPNRRAQLALMDQQWWRDNVPKTLAKSTWDRLDYP